MALAESPPIYNQTARTSNVQPPTRARQTKTTNTTLDTNSPNSVIAEQIRTLFYNAKYYRKSMVGRWNKSHKLLRGNTSSPESTRSRNLPGTSTNEIFPICRSWVGWMTDRRFHNTVSVASAPFTAYSQFFEEVALDLETVLDSTWHVNQEEREVTMAIWDTATYGTGILKTCWDDTLANGMGDAKITRVDPYSFYPDPAATDMNSANYFIEARTMSLQELDRRFPGAAKKYRVQGMLESIDEAPSQLSSSSQIPRANPAAISPATTPRYGSPGGGRVSASSALLDDLGVTVFEAWIREHEVYAVEVEDAERGKSTEQHIYDSWRVIVIAGDNVLLNERAEDIWHHGQHPYSRYVAYDLGEFWGISLVELLADSQRAIDRLINSALSNIDLTGNPVLLEDHNANTQRQQLNNKPGQRISKNKAGDVKWMEPPKIQSDIPQFLSYFLQRMESISGLSAINRGQSPGGRNAAEVHEAVQESAFVGVRMALRMLEYTLRDAGYKKSSLIVENYTIPRMTAITGPEGERSTLALRARHFQLPSDSGHVPMSYTLLVDAGSSTDTSRKVREDKAITLFTLGAIDMYTLLEALNWPHRQQVIERVQQMQQAGLQNPPGKRERARA